VNRSWVTSLARPRKDVALAARPALLGRVSGLDDEAIRQVLALAAVSVDRVI
jgi:hypothetical protein